MSLSNSPLKQFPGLPIASATQGFFRLGDPPASGNAQGNVFTINLPSGSGSLMHIEKAGAARLTLSETGILAIESFLMVGGISTTLGMATVRSGGSIGVVVKAGAGQSASIMEYWLSTDVVAWKLLAQSAGNYTSGMEFASASQILEQSVAIGGSNRLLIKPVGSRLDITNSGGTATIATFDTGEVDFFLNSANNYFAFTSAALTIRGGTNIVLSASTGTKIGTATTQLLGFWNATPVDQPAAIANVATDTVDGTYGAEEATVIGSLRTQLNLVLAALRETGLIAT